MHDVTLFDLLLESESHWPKATAIEFGPLKLSYSEVMGAARAVARDLEALGVGVEGRVAILAESPLEFVVGVLGAVATGAAYVPLDASLPQSRIDWMIQDAGAAAVLVGKNLLRPDSDGPRAVTVDPDRREDSTAAPKALPDNEAYVVYTSGSSGTPKGVSVPHRGIVHTLLTSGALFGARPGARHANLLGWSFDASVQAFWEPLVHGGTLCLFEPALKTDPRALATWIRAERITTLYTTPALLRPLLELASGDLQAVETVVCGGEGMTWPGFREAPMRVFNAYGPTEASVTATAAEVGRGDGPPSIGHPLNAVRAYVGSELGLDDVDAGELVLGGAGIARGYLAAPRMTASRFFPDRHAEAPGQRCYRTGDRVRRDADRSLYFDGRVDRQVKVRGHRIELGEVEAAIRLLPHVREAVVTAVEDELGSRLRGFVALSDKTTSDEIRRALRGSLPEYMVPSEVAVLDALPRLASGKLDMAALALHPATPPVREDPSWTDAERLLCNLYEDVLGISGVRPSDDFIGSGGDSVRVMKLVPLVEAAGLRVEFRDVLSLSIRELATKLQSPNEAPPPDSTDARFDMVSLDDDALESLLEDD